MKRLLAYLFLVLGLGLVFSVNTNADASFKSALDIDKKEKIRFVNNNPYFWGYIFLIDDLRGDGPVYYKILKEEYYRLDKNFNVISEGTFGFNCKLYEGRCPSEKKKIFEFKEGRLKFQFRISTIHKVVDIKSKFYKYKEFKRYHIKLPTKEQRKNVNQSVINFGIKYAGYDESDINLNRLYKIILGNKNIKRKYLKYSKKNAVFNGEKIQTLGLAVFINYKKELLKLTNDKNLKKISPFAWGWGYSTEEDQTNFVAELQAIRKCYKNVKRKKFRTEDGQCIIVDLRRITGDSQNPIVSENYLIKKRDNRLLIAKKSKESEKTKEQIELEKKKEKKLLAKKKKSNTKLPKL